MNCKPQEMYESGEFLSLHPTWDCEDGLWKSAQIIRMLNDVGVQPGSICDIGCGSGSVLAELWKTFPDSELCGFDIAGDAAKFWKEHENKGIRFEVGDFFTLCKKKFDLLMIIDVLEHLSNPFLFLEKLKARNEKCLFLIPLELSAVHVLHERNLLRNRQKYGHINLFTKNIALSLLRESGFRVISCKYTGSGLTMPNHRTILTRLAYWPRRLAFFLNRDIGVRLLGGESILVLAE